ncbi:hypothetical protein Tco_0861748 [Tanacetum coccineum]|uniref:Integrase catalytic domain-containing protein n=1 Tax=Tanacetum coccineum TaxID=301880 RepID=A0ABQ5BIP1_9ASTR
MICQTQSLQTRYLSAITKESKVVKNDNVIAPGIFRINPSKTPREDKFVPINKVRASVRTNLITVSQPHVITKKEVISDSNEVDVEEHHRNSLLSKNNKHMSSECNNVMLSIQNDRSEVVCAMCKQCLIIANHDVCVLNYVNGMNYRAHDRKSKVLINFVWKFLGTVHFGNHHVAAILVRQFYDSDLEVAFRRNTCLVKNLKGVDLLKENRTTNLYTINIHEITSDSPICLMARATSTKSKDEAQEEIKTFLKKITILLQDPVIIVRTKNGTEFKNQVLKEYFDSVGISHQASLQLLRRAILKTAPSFTVDLTKHHTSSLTAENQTYHFYMSSGLSAISRMTVRTLGSLVQKVILASSLFILLLHVLTDSKPGLQGMTSGQISSGLDLTYAPSIITTQQPTEHEFDLLFESMYDDYIGGQPSVATRTALAAQAPQDVDEIETQQQHVQDQNNQALLQPEMVANNVPNAMLDGNTFVNPFALTSISAVESSSLQYVDPSNMHAFYQPYPHEY